MITALTLFLPLAVPQQSVPPRAQVVTPELRAALEAAPDERHRVYVAMNAQLGLEHFLDRVEGLPRAERRALVMRELRAFADASQAPVRDVLAAQVETGHAARVRPLWINNVIQFHGDAVAVEAVAAQPGVAYVQIDPERDLAQVHDDDGSAASAPLATTYFVDDFESGALGAHWSTSTSGCGRVQVTGAHGPAQGGQHVVIDSDTDNCNSTAEMVLTVDLSAATTVELGFWFQDYNDEFDAGQDVLEASDDGGLTWTHVMDLSGADGQYLWQEMDLDPLGLNYVSNFQLRFSWADNYSATTDGFGFDEITLADDVPGPPPPTPEPNLVQLQAPDLWQLGVDGAGTVILNIDSGAEWTHPDLVNRAWVNPLDPVDGVDNDGNGYVDDHVGWDFDSNDNDPSPSFSSHGTNTAGIMVGDGSGGIFLTGMAPGAQMAVAKINGESDHWAAQQWGISVGVDCSSSSHSYKWYFSPKPDYHQHRTVEDMVLAAGIIHANSIGNSGGSSSAPEPWNISAPGLSPAPWRHPDQVQGDGGVSGVMGCGGIELNNSHYGPSSNGPSAWEDVTVYDAGYPHGQNPSFWDYPVGGFGGSLQGLIKPDVVTYTQVVTTSNGGGYNSSFGGTSAATPHLGGAMALMISANPHARPRQVSQALQSTAIDMGTAGKDNLFGAGRIQVKDAALRLMTLVTAADREPHVGGLLDLEISGPPNVPYRLYGGLARGTTSLPGIGDLGIDAARLLKQGTLDASGLAAFQRAIPNDPALHDREVLFQSVADDRGGSGEVPISLVEIVTVRP